MIRKTVKLLVFMAFILACYTKLSMASEIPNTLFAIPLGKITTLANDNSLIDIKSIKQSMGYRVGFGGGIHYYFEPQSVPAKFILPNIKSNKTTPRSPSPFKLYLLPITGSNSSKFEIVAIDWSQKQSSEQLAYQWAQGVCAEYTKTLARQPDDITDFAQRNWYECQFEADNRVLSIGGMGAQSNISLHYPKDIIIAREKAIKSGN